MVRALVEGIDKINFHSFSLAILCNGHQCSKIKSELCSQIGWQLHLRSIKIALRPTSPLWLTHTPVSLIADRSVCHPKSPQVTYHIISLLGAHLSKMPLRPVSGTATMKMPISVLRMAESPKVADPWVSEQGMKEASVAGGWVASSGVTQV